MSGNDAYTIDDLRAENTALRQEIAQLRQQIEAQQDASPAEKTDTYARIDLMDVPVEWHLDQGVCTFLGASVATMFVDTTLASLMSGLQAMVGPERFSLALQSEGRKGIEMDWQIISSRPTFEQGFDFWATFPILAGWGLFRLVHLDREAREAHFEIRNGMEGNYQKALGVCWGSGIAAGKFAGICSILFDTNCWAEQTEFIAQGAPRDFFVVRPSERTIESEIDQLLARDEVTRADLAVALQRLQHELDERQRIEAEQTHLQQQIIASQETALRELSSPLLPLAPHILAMPLIGTIDQTRAAQIVESLLNSVAAHQATIVIIDITGVQSVDTLVAQTIIQAAQAVKLLGAQVVLTGVQPDIAQTLVHLGADLSSIVTRSRLQEGIAHALGTQ